MTFTPTNISWSPKINGRRPKLKGLIYDDNKLFMRKRWLTKVCQALFLAATKEDWKLQIWWHLLKKSLMQNFIFCAVPGVLIAAKFLQHAVTRIWIYGEAECRLSVQLSFVTVEITNTPRHHNIIISSFKTSFFSCNCCTVVTTSKLWKDFKPEFHLPKVLVLSFSMEGL